MAQVTNAPVSPLTALSRRWKLTTALVIVGIGAGIGVTYATPTTYTGEARVAVGSQSLDARLVAGYTDASQQLASDVSRYVNDRQATADLAPVLGDRADDVETVAASPIANSSVVTVEVTATSASAAAEGAQTIAQQLVNQVNGNSSSSQQVLQQYTDITNQVETARQASANADGFLSSLRASSRTTPDALVQAQTAAEQAASALSVLEVQQDALASQYRNAVSNTPSASGLTLVRQGAVTGTDRSREMQRNGLAGGALFGVLALLLAVRLERRRARREQEEALAAQTPSIDLGRDVERSPEPSSRS